MKWKKDEAQNRKIETLVSEVRFVAPPAKARMLYGTLFWRSET